MSNCLSLLFKFFSNFGVVSMILHHKSCNGFSAFHLMILSVINHCFISVISLGL